MAPSPRTEDLLLAASHIKPLEMPEESWIVDQTVLQKSVTDNNNMPLERPESVMGETDKFWASESNKKKEDMLASVNFINQQDNTDENCKETEKFRQAIAKANRAYNETVRERPYIIKTTTNPFLEYWNMIVMIMAIYNGIWTPLTISFDWAMREGE